MRISMQQPVQFLLTLPPRMAREFETLEGKHRPAWFGTSDPAGSRLGSGGGTANLLSEAWRATDGEKFFSSWLRASRKLIIHGGGQSRRLPAYAPVGKLLMPIPAFRWSRGQRLDQTLLDLQLPDYERVLAHAASGTVAMVASGDVLLRFARELPPFPDVDVLGLGMWVRPETARNFGVFFSPRQRPNELAFFLQKPSPARIRELALEHLVLVDTGMWLLSERAVNVLMQRCGWTGERFENGRAGGYELYAQFGLGLGTKPEVKDPLVNALTCAVVPLPEAEFYHFGTSRQMIESISALQNRELDETKLGLIGAKRLPDQFLQNTRFEVPLGLEENHTLWIENSVVPASWSLAHDHVLTGVPANDWKLRLPPGVSLDFAPMGERDFCVRAYGMDDPFSGAVKSANWLGVPAMKWFAARGMTLAQVKINPESDIQQAPLFPVLTPEELEPRFLEWLFATEPESNPRFTEKWRAQRRLSAQQIAEEVNIARLYRQRAANRSGCLLPLFKNARWSVFFRLDLEATAKSFAATDQPLPEPANGSDDHLEPLHAVHDQMFRSAVLRHRRQAGWENHEANAFARLRELIVRDAQLSPVAPRRNVLDDQIIWGRSPIRFDLAGGWTDTPPYCIEYGGMVVNLAANLNGQPPIQVFAKLCPRPEIVVRSIDLGVEQRVRTYEELDTYAAPGSEFALAKAAFALAGFLPRFHAQGEFASLEEQLKKFGGGIELSLLSAVPKGSGLGTSSILAATLLATLGELCGLDWDKNTLSVRTLALEQMLTTGGGWQDQVGAIYRGVKWIETTPGLAQRPSLNWLPDHLLGRDFANRTILLYYTGVTRLAKNILAEIVRGIFLNSPEHLETIAEIGVNATRASRAIQQCDFNELSAVVRNSWRLNQRLDAGTNPTEVQKILAPIQDWLAACKLLGAGGGGYLLMFAKDELAAANIRQTLTSQPPNPRARFVDFALSETGLQLTRS
jgi:galactokinase/mevalonate kinase-like predicted kinase